MPRPCPGASETLLLLAALPDSRGEAAQAGLLRSSVLLPWQMTREVVFHVPCGWRAGRVTSGLHRELWHCQAGPRSSLCSWQSEAPPTAAIVWE